MINGDLVIAKKRRFQKARRYYAKARRASSKMTIPLGLVAGLGASVGRPLKTLIDNPSNVELAMNQLIEGYTGFYPADGSWDMNRLKFGLYPLIAGAMAHKIAGMVGVNRALGKAKVPYLRV